MDLALSSTLKINTPLVEQTSNHPIYFQAPLHSLSKSSFESHALKQMELDRFLSTKYLAHLFGDSFIHETLHEGWFTSDAMLHVIRLLKENPISSKVSGVLKSLEKCFYWQGKILSFLCSDESDETIEADIHKLQSEIARSIFELEIGQSVTFPGGCRGHVVLYEVLRTHEDQIQFNVFNTGAGSHKHWILIEDEGRDGVQGVYTLNHVPIKVFVGQEALTSLIQLRAQPSNNFGYELYENILPSLGGERTEPPLEPTEYMRAQRAGTCAWKTLLAYLRHHLPLDQYKRLKLLARLNVFEKWHSMGKTLNVAKITQELLSKTLVNVEFAHQALDKEVEYTREELLVLGLIKVEKTFKRYHFLLSSQEKKQVQAWYKGITGNEVIDEWGSSFFNEAQKSV